MTRSPFQSGGTQVSVSWDSSYPGSRLGSVLSSQNGGHGGWAVATEGAARQVATTAVTRRIRMIFSMAHLLLEAVSLTEIPSLRSSTERTVHRPPSRLAAVRSGPKK